MDSDKQPATHTILIGLTPIEAADRLILNIDGALLRVDVTADELTNTVFLEKLFRALAIRTVDEAYFRAAD